MTYQLSDLITEVRSRAKDPSFDVELITSFLQEAQDEILNRSRYPFMQESVDDVAPEGTTSYELDYDVDTILSIRLTDPDNGNDIVPRYMPFQRLDEEFVNRVNGKPTTPAYWSLFGDEIHWQAPLNKSYDIALAYVRTPKALTNNEDVPDIPERFKQVLIRGALARVEEYRGNFDIAAIHERKVEELAEDMLVRAASKQITTPHKVKFNRSRRSGVWEA